MGKILAGAIAGAFAIGALAGAGAAQAAPFEYVDNPSPFVAPGPNNTVIDTNPSPWDFTGDVIRFLGFETQFISDGTVFGPGYQGVKGPRGADLTGPRQAGRPGG